METINRKVSVKKTDYKDYVNFLDNYKNGKKDDNSSVTSTNDSGVVLSDSLNSSTVSINSDGEEKGKTNIKIELCIQINQPENNNQNNISEIKIDKVKVLDLQLPKNEEIKQTSPKHEETHSKPPVPKIGEVNKTRKIFENNCNQQSATLPRGGGPIRKNSIKKISKVFENNQPINKNNHQQNSPKSVNKLPINIFQNNNNNNDNYSKEDALCFKKENIFVTKRPEEEGEEKADVVDAKKSVPIPPPPPPPTNNANAFKPQTGVGAKPAQNGADFNEIELKKKLANGMLRDMCNSYHNKANQYVSTLPRDTVQRNKNLQGIINQIASQGGLDKLSGRSNPKKDTD